MCCWPTGAAGCTGWSGSADHPTAAGPATAWSPRSEPNSPTKPRPPGTGSAPAAYAPPTALADHVRAAYPTCTRPGCHRASSGCDLDHDEPWPRGPTSVTNINPKSRRCHRWKTLGLWRSTMHPDGTISWTSSPAHASPTDPNPSPDTDPARHTHHRTHHRRLTPAPQAHRNLTEGPIGTRDGAIGRLTDRVVRRAAPRNRVHAPTCTRATRRRHWLAHRARTTPQIRTAARPSDRPPPPTRETRPPGPRVR